MCSQAVMYSQAATILCLHHVTFYYVSTGLMQRHVVHLLTVGQKHHI